MESLKRVRKRQKRCYELAWRAMDEEPGAEKFTLCHGIGPRHLRVPHAWIETGDGRVYDPVDNAYTPIEDYTGVAEHRYSHREALRLGCCQSPLWPMASHTARCG
jgi:hypothetical protein